MPNPTQFTALDAQLLREHDARLSAVESDVIDLKKAFPGADVDGHRRYHELIIEQIEGKKRLRQAILEKTIPGILWAAFAWIAVACWSSLKSMLAFVLK